MKRTTHYHRDWARRARKTDPTLRERERLAAKRYRDKKKAKSATHKRGRKPRINDDYEESRPGFCRDCGVRATRKNGRYCEEHLAKNR